MPVTYTPFNGDAGKITAKLYRRSNNAYLSPHNLLLYVFNFKEKDEESELNEIFTNVNDKLVKDFYGYRKRINFTLVNSAKVARAHQDATAFYHISKLIYCINQINLYPETFRLEIQYRTSAVHGTIIDAMYVGDFELNELREDSNIAQLIPLEFVSVYANAPLNYGLASDTSGILLEGGEGSLLLENGSKLLLEQYTNFTL